MECRNHPGREAIAVCEKHSAGFCEECCECEDLETCCGCLEPGGYCQSRSQCLIWELSRERRKEGR